MIKFKLLHGFTGIVSVLVSFNIAASLFRLYMLELIHALFNLSLDFTFQS